MLNAAQKAWITRRAKLAAAVATIVAGSPDQPVVIMPAVTVDTGIKLPPPPKSGRIGDAVVAPAAAWQAPRVAMVSADAMVPATEFEMVEMRLDDAAIGCGQFRLIVIERSDRTVRLFNAPKLATVTVSREHFEKTAKPARHVRRAVLADIIRRNLALADRVNGQAQRIVMDDGGRFAVAALTLLQS